MRFNSVVMALVLLVLAHLGAAVEVDPKPAGDTITIKGLAIGATLSEASKTFTEKTSIPVTIWGPSATVHLGIVGYSREQMAFIDKHARDALAKAATELDTNETYAKRLTEILWSITYNLSRDMFVEPFQSQGTKLKLDQSPPVLGYLYATDKLTIHEIYIVGFDKMFKLDATKNVERVAAIMQGYGIGDDFDNVMQWTEKLNDSKKEYEYRRSDAVRLSIQIAPDAGGGSNVIRLVGKNVGDKKQFD